MTNGGLSFGGDNELDLTLELELSLSQPSSHLDFFLLWVGVKYDDILYTLQKTGGTEIKAGCNQQHFSICNDDIGMM